MKGFCIVLIQIIALVLILHAYKYIFGYFLYYAYNYGRLNKEASMDSSLVTSLIAIYSVLTIISFILMVFFAVPSLKRLLPSKENDNNNLYTNGFFVFDFIAALIPIVIGSILFYIDFNSKDLWHYVWKHLEAEEKDKIKARYNCTENQSLVTENKIMCQSVFSVYVYPYNERITYSIFVFSCASLNILINIIFYSIAPNECNTYNGYINMIKDTPQISTINGEPLLYI